MSYRDTLEVKGPKITGTPSDTAHKAIASIPVSTLTDKEVTDRLISTRINMLLQKLNLEKSMEVLLMTM